MEELPEIKTAFYSSTSLGEISQYNWSSSGSVPKENIQSTLEYNKNEEEEEMETREITKRKVQVIIVDPDKNVPAKDSLLYESESVLTDLINEELFYEIGMKPLLEEHNRKRKIIKNKEQSNKFGKTIYLEPIKIRDLKMVVVEIAVF